MLTVVSFLFLGFRSPKQSITNYFCEIGKVSTEILYYLIIAFSGIY